MEKFKFLPKEKIARLPKTPGVYAFRKEAKLLYIGKAINIRNRAGQHHDLINLAGQVGYIRTDSEIDALILEAKLIKKYQPKYNTVWRDDKKYFYVAATKEDFPQIFVTHQPFVSSTPQVIPTLRVVRLERGLRPLYKKTKALSEAKCK